jgi:hypothetical protein
VQQLTKTTASALAAFAAIMLLPTAADAATSSSFEIAFQASSSRLTEINPAGQVTTTASAMAAQSSPSLTVLPDGSFDEAFAASDRTLWLANSVSGGSQVKQTTCSPDPYPVFPGTSPSVAVSSTHVLEIEFSEGGEENGLNIPVHNGVCSFSHGDIADGTSPVVAPVPGPLGGGFVSAWVAKDGLVWFNEQNKPAHIAGQGFPAAPGTSPAVAVNASGQVRVAYHDSHNRLTTVTGDLGVFPGATDETPSFLAANTSPSLVVLPDGTFDMAFTASDNTVWVDLNGTGHRLQDGLTAEPGTSPAIAVDAQNNWEIAFQHGGDHHLITFDSHSTKVDTGQLVAAGTNPAIVALAAGQAPLTLNKGQVVNGFIPFAGKFPPFGSTRPGRVTAITYPASGFLDTTLLFVKAGHSTSQCGDPNAVVPVKEGSTTTPAQLSAIFGTATPPFSTTSPFGAVACFSGPNPTPSFINLSMNVQFN